MSIQRKISNVQYIVPCGHFNSTVLPEGIMKSENNNWIIKEKIQKEKASKSMKKPIDLLDFSKPKTRNIIINYIESGINRASNPRSLLLKNAIEHDIVRIDIERQDSLAENEMQKLITTLKNTKRSEKSELELIILDTSYINSIVRENGSIRDVIFGLHDILSSRGIDFEIILTQGVYNELISQLNNSKRDESGRLVMTSEALNELHQLIYGGKQGEKSMISLENYSSTEESRKELSQILKKRNKKKNLRCGMGDVSILECIKMFASMKTVTFNILTLDSDFKKILNGCNIVRVIKSLTFNRKNRRKLDICLDSI